MTTQDYMLVLIGYDEIYGFSGGGVGRVQKEIKDYNLNAVLETASKISLRLFSGGVSDRNTQITLVKDIFAKDLGVRKGILSAIKRIKAENWVVFAEQPILCLFKVALMYADKNGGKSITPADIQKVGHWLLVLSDECMGSEHNSPITVPSEYVRETLREYISRQYFFMGRERLPYRLARFKDIFEKIREIQPKFDIDRKFSLATDGVSLNDYISFCFFLLVNWVNKTTRDIDITKEWVVCKKKYFEQTQLSLKEIDKVLTALLLDVSNYHKNYEESVKALLGGKDIFTFNFLQLRQRPLLSISPECFVCPSPYFLMDKATDGIYWIIENYLKDKGLDKDRDLFPSVWGDAFEEYVHERLLGTFNKRYFKNPTLRGEETADGLVNGDSYIFMVETKYAHWTYKAKLTGKFEDMLPTLRQFFLSGRKTKGLGQITRNIKRIESNQISLPFGRRGRKIVPILIVGEGMPMDAYNRKKYENLAKNLGSYYESISVLPFIVLDAEEVEIIEAIGIEEGWQKAEGLLANYSQMFLRRNELGFVRESMQFKNYLHSTGYKEPNNPNLFKLFDKIHKTATKKAAFRKKTMLSTNIRKK